MNIAERGELLPQSDQLLIDTVVTAVRKKLAKGMDIGLTAFMVKDGDAKVLPLTTLPSKDFAMMALRAIADLARPDMVLLVYEGWGNEFEGSQKDADELREKYDSVRDMPGSFDAVIFHVETYQGSWFARPRTTAHDGEPRELEEPTFRFMEMAEGRMTAFLPARGTTH